MNNYKVTVTYTLENNKTSVFILPLHKALEIKELWKPWYDVKVIIEEIN